MALGWGWKKRLNSALITWARKFHQLIRTRTKACNPSEEPVLRGSFERVSTGSSTSIEEIDMICFMSISAM